MSSGTEEGFTEGEKLEFNRRYGELSAIIHRATVLFSEMAELDNEINNKNKSLKSYWYVAIFLAGMALSWFLRKSPAGFELNFGSFISLLVLAKYFSGKYEVAKITKRRSEIVDMLSDIEMRWCAVTGSVTFWDLRVYVKEPNFYRNENYTTWLNEQRDLITQSMCGWERYQEIKNLAVSKTDL